MARRRIDWGSIRKLALGPHARYRVDGIEHTAPGTFQTRSDRGSVPSHQGDFVVSTGVGRSASRWAATVVKKRDETGMMRGNSRGVRTGGAARLLLRGGRRVASPRGAGLAPNPASPLECLTPVPTRRADRVELFIRDGAGRGRRAAP